MTLLYRPPGPASLQILTPQRLTDRAHPTRRRTRAMLYMTHKRLFNSRLRNTSICISRISIILLSPTLQTQNSPSRSLNELPMLGVPSLPSLRTLGLSFESSERWRGLNALAGETRAKSPLLTSLCLPVFVLVY
jgi:hypothetical protein